MTITTLFRSELKQDVTLAKKLVIFTLVQTSHWVYQCIHIRLAPCPSCGDANLMSNKQEKHKANREYLCQ